MILTRYRIDEGVIQQGVLLKVEKSFVALIDERISYTDFERDRFVPKTRHFKRSWYVTKNQILEIRYPYAWHFRNTCNTYAHAPEDILREHCSLFGYVDRKVRWENDKKLSEILSQDLFKPYGHEE